jgi:hypothetical protein
MLQLRQFKFELISYKYITNTMFFKSEDKTDHNIDIYKILQEELSKHLVVKQKSTQIKVLPTNNKNTDNNAFNIKVKSNITNIKSQGWHYS